MENASRHLSPRATAFLDPNVRSLYILNLALKSLEHRLRTPLSVISNDLNYLKLVASSKECDRALEAVRYFSILLSQSCNVGAPFISPQREPLSEVLNHFIKEGYLIGSSCEKTKFVNITKQQQ